MDKHHQPKMMLPTAQAGVRDPVCEMTVDPEKTPHRFAYKGVTYFFCCEHCLARFSANPDAYLQAAPAPGAAHTHAAPAPQAPAAAHAMYTCPMHPEVQWSQPGQCLKCSMVLVPTAPPQPAPQTNTTGPHLSRQEQLAQLRAQLQRVSEQQAALARQIEQLLATVQASPPSKVVQEAEEVARAAKKRE